MIIFLYGPDDYRRNEKKHELIAEFKKKRSATGVAFFDMEAVAAQEELASFLRNQSIFDTGKLAVVENAFEWEATKLTKFAKFLTPFVEDKNNTLLIVEKDKPVKALAFLLEKPTLSQKFEQLAGAEWHAFIKVHARKYDIQLTDSTVQFLGTVYEGNTWGLVTELQKLSGLALAQAGKPVDRKDLNAFDLEVAPNYWGLMNGLKSYDMKARLFALEKMLALNDPAAKIFNILASQWAEKIPHMAEYDLAVKSGKVDYEEALVDLLIS